MLPKHKPGSFWRIPFPDGSFGYGRALELHFDAFYNYRTTSPDSDLDRIASKPVLFRIMVKYPYPKSWELIGRRELEARLTQPIVQFRMEVGPLRRCWIFDTPGNSREASPQECIGLEPAAVWESHGVEERLLDAFHVQQPPVPPRTLTPSLPEPFEHVVLKLMEKHPERRYPSAAALRSDLARLWPLALPPKTGSRVPPLPSGEGGG